MNKESFPHIVFDFSFLFWTTVLIDLRYSKWRDEMIKSVKRDSNPSLEGPPSHFKARNREKKMCTYYMNFKFGTENLSWFVHLTAVVPRS